MSIHLILRKLIRILLIVLLVLITLVAALGVIEIIADVLFDHTASIDACLDSRGRWDQVHEICEGRRSINYGQKWLFNTPINIPNHRPNRAIKKSIIYRSFAVGRRSCA